MGSTGDGVTSALVEPAVSVRGVVWGDRPLPYCAMVLSWVTRRHVRNDATGEVSVLDEDMVKLVLEGRN